MSNPAPMQATIEWISPSGLALVLTGPTKTATVVHLVGATPAPGYQVVFERYVTSHLHVGDQVPVVVSGYALDPDALIPTWEVCADPSFTMSELLIAKGWAVASTWDGHARVQQQMNALAMARREHHGFWGEVDPPIYSTWIPQDILGKTMPRVPSAHFPTGIALLAVLALSMVVAVREYRWKRLSTAKRGYLKRLGLSYIGMRPGLLKPMTPDEEAIEAAQAARAAEIKKGAAV